MRGAYYNENNPYCAQWIRNLIKAGLIADGDVDDRSIECVQPGDLEGYCQAHFFAGLGGWSYALRLAGWPDDCHVWTGSCPCQPISVAGQRKGHADERHLWPAFHGLIAERRPAVLFGEQVAGKDGLEWLAGVRADMEASGYAVGAADIPAASAGAPHIRQRLFFVAHAKGNGRHARRARDTEERTRGRQLGGGRFGSHVPDANVSGLAFREGQSRDVGAECSAAIENGWWNTEPDVGRVADGISARVDKLRALGNAIVPQVAAEFIAAARDALA